MPNLSATPGTILLFLEAISFILFIVLAIKDPGYEQEQIKINKLYSEIKPDFICPYCSVKKLNSTIHCHHCRKCVRVRRK